MRNVVCWRVPGRVTGLLTGSIDEVGLSFRGRWRQQLVIELVGAEGARVVPLASVHDSVGHHDVPQRVVQVAVQQAALVLGWRHVVLGLHGRTQPWVHADGHAHHGGALLLDDALVQGLGEILRTALCPLRVVSICNIRTCSHDCSVGGGQEVFSTTRTIS